MNAQEARLLSEAMFQTVILKASGQRKWENTESYGQGLRKEVNLLNHL